MKFPNAAKGVKQIFYAIIISIIVMALSVVGALFVLLAGENEKSPLFALAGFIGIAVLVGAIAYLVLELVGTNRASKDNDKFKTAFYCIIANLIFSIIGGFFNSNLIQDVVSVMTTALDLALAYYIFTGIIELATDIKNDVMVEKGKKFRKLYVIIFIVALILDAVAAFTDTAEGLLAISSVLSMVAGIASIAAFVLFFLYVKEAVPMLENARIVEEKKEDELDALNLDAAEEKKDDFE